MKNYPEWNDKKILIDLANRFATCYENDDGTIFYIEPQFYTYLQGYKRLRPELYDNIIKKMDEIVRKNKFVIFQGDENYPLIEKEGYIYLTAMDVANQAKVIIEPESTPSNYGD